MFQLPPEGFYVVVFEGDIRMIQVDPITHFAGQVVPFTLEFEHFLAANAVVLFYRNLFADIFFGDTQRLFYAQFNRQSMGIPAALAVYLKTLHGFVAAYQIFDGTRNDVMDTRHSIGAWGPFVKHKCGFAFPVGNAFFEYLLSVPEV